MTFTTARWRGADRIFAQTVGSVLTIPINIEAATVTIAASDRSVLAFSVHDGDTELVILTNAAGVDVHKRIDGIQVGPSVALTELDADQVRTACHDLCERIKAQGGFDNYRESTH